MILLTENNPTLAREKGYLVNEKHYTEGMSVVDQIKGWFEDRGDEDGSCPFTVQIKRHVFRDICTF